MQQLFYFVGWDRIFNVTWNLRGEKTDFKAKSLLLLQCHGSHKMCPLLHTVEVLSKWKHGRRSTDMVVQFPFQWKHLIYQTILIFITQLYREASKAADWLQANVGLMQHRYWLPRILSMETEEQEEVMARQFVRLDEENMGLFTFEFTSLSDYECFMSNVRDKLDYRPLTKLLLWMKRKWMNEQTNEWMNEQTNKWMNNLYCQWNLERALLGDW